jgi:malonyl-CoA decarboxylase
LIFTEVALTRGLSAKVQPILDPSSPVLEPRTCDSAIFYSISNCQPGLRGFSFGNQLLGRAIEQLSVEMPWLRRFATISPIPGFRPWLSATIASLHCSTDVATWLGNARSAAASDAAIPAGVPRDLLPLCAHYLLNVEEGSEPADPVARFHLANGARLHRLNWLSDTSRAGLERSASLTANYVYDVAELERNVETYRRDHEVYAARQVEQLARAAAPLL